MAKIKSTMDLVMEKTRDMTLSESEKLEQNKTEAVKQVQGLIQQYQDKAIKLTEFERQFANIQQTYDDGSALKTREMLLEQLLSKFDLDADNTRLLELLKTAFDIDPSEFKSVFNDFQQQLESARKKHTAELTSQLAQKNGISGSAVKPNASRNKKWQEIAEGIKQQFRRHLEKNKGNYTFEK